MHYTYCLQLLGFIDFFASAKYIFIWIRLNFAEGDRKAYYETSQFAMKKNRESILKLRKENKELHKKLSDSLSVSKKCESINS